MTYRSHIIGLVIPAYNEAKLLPATLAGVPPFIDFIYVVDDCSPDNQVEVVKSLILGDPRIRLLQHSANQGPGQAVITGYSAALKAGCDAILVVGGDNQMLLTEAERFLDPIIEGRADYAKGNRFLLSQLDDTLQKMPKIRLFGNILITAAAKIASGYYKTMDFVDGYTAIGREAVQIIDWSRAWKEYGYPIDFLIRMNAYNLVCVDVPRTAVYLPGERQSQIKGLRYFLRVTPMMIRGFLWRISFKYIYRDFHPLVLFLVLGLVFFPLGVGLGAYMFISKIFLDGTAVTGARAVLSALLILSSMQFLLFAMLFDMEHGQGVTRERISLKNVPPKA